MQLARDAPKVNLALSLHAPNQDLRIQLVPSAKAWHIDKIMEALDEFIYRQNLEQARMRTVLIECKSRPRCGSPPRSQSACVLKNTIDQLISSLSVTLFRVRNSNESAVLVTTLADVLIAGVNDSEETAHELGALLKNRAIVLNVIP